MESSELLVTPCLLRREFSAEREGTEGNVGPTRGDTPPFMLGADGRPVLSSDLSPADSGGRKRLRAELDRHDLPVVVAPASDGRSEEGPGQI